MAKEPFAEQKISKPEPEVSWHDPELGFGGPKSPPKKDPPQPDPAPEKLPNDRTA